MKRFAIGLGLVGALLLPGMALAFHHTDLPSTDCAADAAGSPSNNNGEAKQALLASYPFGLPLPPAGDAGQSGLVPPGNGQGEGGEFCAFG